MVFFKVQTFVDSTLPKTNYLFLQENFDTLGFALYTNTTVLFDAMVVFVRPVKSQKRGKHKHFVHAQ